MDNLSIFAERLTELLLDNKYAPKKLAETVNVTPSVAYRWLKGVSYPTLENLIAISDTFAVSLDYLLGRTNEQYAFKPNTVADFPTVLDKLLNERTTEYRLCKDTKISRSKIHDWRNGNRLPLVDGLIILADYFNCSIDALIGRETLQ